MPFLFSDPVFGEDCVFDHRKSISIWSNRLRNVETSNFGAFDNGIFLHSELFTGPFLCNY
jgi:hypothetical protein